MLTMQRPEHLDVSLKEDSLLTKEELYLSYREKVIDRVTFLNKLRIIDNPPRKKWKTVFALVVLALLSIFLPFVFTKKVLE